MISSTIMPIGYNYGGIRMVSFYFVPYDCYMHETQLHQTVRNKCLLRLSILYKKKNTLAPMKST